MVLWCYWVSIWVTNATIATGVVGYLTSLIPALNANPMLPAITGLCLIWIFVVVNMSHRPAARSMRITSPVRNQARPPPAALSGDALRIEGLSEVPD